MLRFLSFILSLGVILIGVNYFLNYAGFDKLPFLSGEREVLFMIVIYLIAVITLILTVHKNKGKEKIDKRAKNKSYGEFYVVQENEYGTMKIGENVIINAVQTILNPKEEIEEYMVSVGKKEDNKLEIKITTKPNANKEFSLIEFTKTVQEEIKNKIYEFSMIEVQTVQFEYVSEK
jgi:hypothetical protein